MWTHSMAPRKSQFNATPSLSLCILTAASWVMRITWCQMSKALSKCLTPYESLMKTAGCTCCKDCSNDSAGFPGTREEGPHVIQGLLNHWGCTHYGRVMGEWSIHPSTHWMSTHRAPCSVSGLDAGTHGWPRPSTWSAWPCILRSLTLFTPLSLHLRVRCHRSFLRIKISWVLLWKASISRLVLIQLNDLYSGCHFIFVINTENNSITLWLMNT